MNTPIVFIIFNRADTAAKAFECIRAVQPKQLFVIADGPRASRPSEAERCAETRAIIQNVDWNCDVQTNFSDENLGCRQRISSGLDWVFSQTETAIILEDDCIPHPSFFPYCEELLERYRDDKRVLTVSGDNYQLGRRRTDDSYYFSRYNHCWGWATWRRSWNLYDNEMALWPRVRDEGWLADILVDPATVRYWTMIFDLVYANKIDTWAFRMAFVGFVHNAMTILPNVNLVSNIGFDTNATHTTTATTAAFLPALPMEFPLKHPPFLIRDSQADAFTQRTHFDVRMSFQARLKRKYRKLTGQPI